MNVHGFLGSPFPPYLPLNKLVTKMQTDIKSVTNQTGGRKILTQQINNILFIHAIMTQQTSNILFIPKIMAQMNQ